MQPKQQMVLIVEDEEAIAGVLKNKLLQAGISVGVASDGKTGLRQLLTNSFDLLLVDIRMPHMDGLEMIKKWRKHKPKNRTPIIILTNLTEVDATETELKKLGVIDTLIKADESLERVAEKIRARLHSIHRQKEHND